MNEVCSIVLLNYQRVPSGKTNITMGNHHFYWVNRGKNQLYLWPFSSLQNVNVYQRLCLVHTFSYVSYFAIWASELVVVFNVEHQVSADMATITPSLTDQNCFSS